MSKRQASIKITRFRVEKKHPIVNGHIRWDETFYEVTPRHYSTALLKITKPEHTAQKDFDEFMGCVRELTL